MTHRPWCVPQLTDRPRMVVLTTRQAQILDGIVCGQSNAQIARRTGLSVNSIGSHSNRLYARLGARDRAHAAALACSGQVRVCVPSWDEQGRWAG